MSSAESKDITALAARVASLKQRIIADWDAKVNEEDGSFEAVFGDPSKTPCTCIASCHMVPDLFAYAAMYA